MAYIKGKWKWNFPEINDMEESAYSGEYNINFTAGGKQYSLIKLDWGTGLNTVYYNNVPVRYEAYYSEQNYSVGNKIANEYLLMDFGDVEQYIDDRLFNFINNFAVERTNVFNKIDRAAAFNPISAFPIDGRTYFESFVDAEAAAASAEWVGSSASQYYIGQTLTVFNGGEVAYYSIEPDKTLTKLNVLREGINEYSIQQNETGSLAGVKGFYWTEVVNTHFLDGVNGGGVSLKLAKTTFDEGLVEPTEDEIKAAFKVGDVLTIHAGSKFDKAATVSSIYTNDFNSAFCHLVLSVPQNLLTAIAELKNNEYKAGMGFSDNAIFCPAKPAAGVVDFGKYSFAAGEASKAINYAATAFGRQNEAYGQYAAAFGRENKVGYAGFAAGRNNTVTGESAAALNQGNTASGNWSFAGGYKSQATGSSAIAYGQMAKATGLYSTAFGEQAEAKGAGALAVGRYAKAEGEASQAFGRNTIAKSAFQFVAGKYNEEDSAQNYAYILGGGHADNNRINIHTVDWYGNAWYKGNIVGVGDVKAGSISLTTTSETANQAKDTANEAKNLAKARTGLQRGSYNELYNYQNENAAPCFRGSTDYSHAEGYIFGGVENHYIEDSSFAHIEGSQNRVIRSNGAHASGEWQQIYDSKDAAAFGHDNRISNAPNGFAAGHGNKVTKANQVVVGEFNSEDNEALFIVGNGESNTDRKNAFVIKEDNTGYLGNKKVLVAGDTYTKAEIDSALEQNRDDVLTTIGTDGISTYGNVLVQTTKNASLQNKTEITPASILVSSAEGLYQSRLNTTSLTINAGSAAATINLTGWHDSETITTSISSADTTIGRNLTVGGTLSIGGITINAVQLAKLLNLIDTIAIETPTT